MTGPSNETIPHDFPRPGAPAALAGAQPKLALIEVDGRYAAPEASPAERAQLHAGCELLANRIAAATRQVAATNGIAPDNALTQGLVSLRERNYWSDDFNLWTIRRAAQINGWPAPGFAPAGTVWIEPSPQLLDLLHSRDLRPPILQQIEELLAGLQRLIPPQR